MRIAIFLVFLAALIPGDAEFYLEPVSGNDKAPGIVIFGNKWPQGEHVVNIENKKHLSFNEWSKFEKKRPLALTVSQGKGEVLKVNHPEVFYAEFFFSSGRKITPGDMIFAGKAKVQEVKVDIPGKKLHLDRNISWKKNVSVQYLFKH